MSKSENPRKKFVVEFVPSNAQVDIKSPDPQSLLVQLMLQVAKIGLRIDGKSINSNILEREN